MPTYTYKCKPCDIVVEQIHGMKEDPNVLCGECGDPMDKIITNCNYVLKGSGWVGRDITEKKEREDRSERLGKITKDKVRNGHFN